MRIHFHRPRPGNGPRKRNIPIIPRQFQKRSRRHTHPARPRQHHVASHVVIQFQSPRRNRRRPSIRIRRLQHHRAISTLRQPSRTRNPNRTHPRQRIGRRRRVRETHRRRRHVPSHRNRTATRTQRTIPEHHRIILKVLRRTPASLQLPVLRRIHVPLPVHPASPHHPVIASHFQRERRACVHHVARHVTRQRRHKCPQSRTRTRVIQQRIRPIRNQSAHLRHRQRHRPAPRRQRPGIDRVLHRTHLHPHRRIPRPKTQSLQTQCPSLTNRRRRHRPRIHTQRPRRRHIPQHQRSRPVLTEARTRRNRRPIHRQIIHR